jgi:hypothetical protein
MWVGVFILAILFLWTLWIGLRGVYRAIFPSTPTTPSASFGTISSPNLTASKVNLTKTVFNVELPEGSLPETPTELAVYPIPKPAGTLSSLDQAIDQVRPVGFRDPPKKQSEVNYLWKDSKKPAKSIKLNIATGDFVYKYDHLKDPSILEGKFKLTDLEAIKQARKFLQKLNSFPDDLDNDLAEINFYKLKNKKRTMVTSFSEANTVEVLFFRTPIEDKYKMVQPTPNTSHVKVVLGPNLGLERGVVEAEYAYWTIDLDNPSAYPLKSSQSAWSEFQEGKASFVKGKVASYDEIFLADVYLAYYETKTYQPFLQPIFVFTGSGTTKGKLIEFEAYLPAISNEYIK